VPVELAESFNQPLDRVSVDALTHHALEQSGWSRVRDWQLAIHSARLA
jgi:hypothetical protein